MQSKINIPLFRRNVASRPIVTFDELDTSPKHFAQRFSIELDDMVENGWERHGQHVPSLAPPLPWNEHDRSFSFHLNAWEPLTFLLKGSCVVDDAVKRKTYFDVSYTMARSWIETFQVPFFGKEPAEVLTEENTEKDGYAWYDMGVGQRICRMAYILDVMARDDQYSDDDVELFYNSLMFHHELLLVDDFFKVHSNHGLYQALGQLAAAKRFKDIDEGSEKYFSIATKRLWRCLDQHFSKDNVHKEHSAGYHYMILGSLIGSLQTDLIEDTDILKRIDEMETALTWMIQPNHGLITFGDSDPRSMYRGSKLGERFTQSGLQYIISGGKVGVRPKTGVQAYKAAGYAFARLLADDVEPLPKNETYLAQQAGFHSRVHKHADHLTFIWYDKCREILIDPGRYAYVGKTTPDSELFQQGYWYSDPKRIYVESTHAHNCVEIDGKSYPRRGAGARPFGSALKHATEQDGLAVTECMATHFRTVRHWRGLIMAPGRFMLVLDWLNDRVNAHDYRQWFKFHSDWQIAKDGEFLRGLSLQTENRDATSLTMASLLPDTKFSDICLGQEEPRMAGWMSDAAYSMVPAPSVAVEGLNRNMASFATLFTFGDTLEVDRKKTRTNASLKNGKLFWTDAQGDVALEFSRSITQKLTVSMKTS